MGLGRSVRLHGVVEEEEKDLLLWWYEGGNHNSVLLWPGYPPACKTKTSGLRSSDHISQLAKNLTGLMRGTQIVPWPRKNNLPMNITMNGLWKITRRNPVDSAIVVQVAVVFSTSCRGCPLMVLWMRTSRNTVESHILHSLTRKTKVTGHLLEDKTASIDPKCKLYIRPKGSLQFITPKWQSCWRSEPCKI